MRLLLPLVLTWVSLVSVSECALAAMSIDLGTQFIKIGIVKPGSPMDISLNPESRRKTPNLVMLHDGHRTFGDAALGMQVRHPQHVFANLLDLVGKSPSHPSYATFLHRNDLYQLSSSPRNESGISFQIGEESYSVETLLAMTLANAKKFTEDHAQVPSIKDVVITVPAYFTPTERLAVERAAQMADLNVLQLINDGTAAALSHGIFRRKEITEKPQRLMIYDMGSAKTTATIVEYKLVKGKYDKQPTMTVLGVGFDRTLGGQEMTFRLLEHLIENFEKTYKPKTPVRSNRRALAKFTKEAERLKQVLSANAEHFAQIESAHEDIDAKIRVTREDFNRLIADLESRISEPVEQSLRIAQMPIDDIDQIVLMGAGTRVPKVKEIVQRAIGNKELGKFLNTDEAVAMGALFQAAHLSNGFKVKPFNVEELVLFPVEVQFVSKSKDEADETKTIAHEVRKTLFAAKSLYPSNTKSISLTSYDADFSISMNYGLIEHITKKQLTEMDNLLTNLTIIDIRGLTKELANRSADETEFKGVKVSFRLDESGIVRVFKAEATIEKKSIVGSITDTLSGLFSSKTEEGEPTTDDSSNGKDKDDVESETSEETQTEEATDEKEKMKAPNASEETAGTEQNEKKAANATEKKDKKKERPTVVRLRLKTTYPTAHVPNKYDVADAKQRLQRFAEVELLAAARAAAENELESFNFEASLMLEEQDFIEASSEEERKDLEKEVARIRTWLEDDVTKETKTGDFKENLAILKKIVNGVKSRAETAKVLPEKLTTLETLLNTSLTLARMGDDVDESKALFEKKDRDAMKTKLDKLKVWLEGHKTKIEQRKKHDDFPVTVKEIDTKISKLNKEVDKFMKKMRKVTDMKDLKDKIDIEEVAAEAETKKQEEEKIGKKKDGEKEETKKNETTKEAKIEL